VSDRHYTNRVSLERRGNSNGLSRRRLGRAPPRRAPPGDHPAPAVLPALPAQHGQAAPPAADRSARRLCCGLRSSRPRRRARPRAGLCSMRAGLAHERSSRYASQRRYRLRVTAALRQRRAGVPLRLCGAARPRLPAPRGLGNVGHLASPLRPPGGTAVCRRRGPRHGVRMQGPEPPHPPPLKSAARTVGRPPRASAAGAASARCGGRLRPVCPPGGAQKRGRHSSLLCRQRA